MTAPALTRVCMRAGCAHPGDWHRLDDAQNVGPGDPAARFRCLGYDVTQDGPPRRECDCPDMLPPPDPRPFGYIGRWPACCPICGHRHTAGQPCAEHTWTDGCHANAGPWCGTDHDVPVMPADWKPGVPIPGTTMAKFEVIVGLPDGGTLSMSAEFPTMVATDPRARDDAYRMLEMQARQAAHDMPAWVEQQ